MTENHGGVIGQRIITLREERDWSQDELAAKLHIKQNQVSRMERNKSDTKGSIIRKLCILFDVDADYLLGLQDERKRSVSSELSFEQQQLLSALRNKNIKSALKLLILMSDD